MPRADVERKKTQTPKNEHRRKIPNKSIRLKFLCVSRHPTLRVGDLDTQSLRLRNDLNTLPRGDGVANLGGVGPVVHQEEVDVVGVLDEESLVAGRHHVAGLLVGTIANLSIA